ncbi:MAG: hypothetical protein AB7Q27_12840, partial [Acidimicrobiia bacterium]
MSKFRRSATLAVAGLMLLAACGDDSSSSSSATTAAASGATTAATAASGTGPGAGSTKVGFIFVGPKDDYGYNQAAYEGSQAVGKAHPDLEVLTAETVPEDDSAT